MKGLPLGSVSQLNTADQQTCNYLETTTDRYATVRESGAILKHDIAFIQRHFKSLNVYIKGWEFVCIICALLGEQNNQNI